MGSARRRGVGGEVTPRLSQRVPVAEVARAHRIVPVPRPLRRAARLVLEALPIVPLARLLAGRRLARVPVVLCVDIEPDDRSTGSGPKPWRGFERIARELVPPLRRQLSAATGERAAFSWALR